MFTIYKNAQVYAHGRLKALDLAVDGARIAKAQPGLSVQGYGEVLDFSNRIIIPGFVDVHVHLREPGFFYKETIETGTRAAARGGYTAICSMPNVDPPPDTRVNLEMQHALIEKGAQIPVYPYATLTVGRKGRGEPVDFGALSDLAIAFSDDGTGVQSEEVMRACMQNAAQTGALVCAHCEDERLLEGGYIHAGSYALLHGHKGISSQSEWGQVERDLRLAEQTGCRYHVCHISTKESVDLIRCAKARGVDVTCETAPHYLILNDMNMQEHGRFKMNPPIRSEQDRLALIQGLLDGTIDMIATDHAPHSMEEKDKGLAGSLMGVVGLETAFAVLYTHLVEKGIMTLSQLLFKMCDAPRARFGIPGGIFEGAPATFAILELDTPFQVDPSTFLSNGRATPFEGDWVRGQCVRTVIDGRKVYDARDTQK